MINHSACMNARHTHTSHSPRTSCARLAAPKVDIRQSSDYTWHAIRKHVVSVRQRRSAAVVTSWNDRIPYSSLPAHITAHVGRPVAASVPRRRTIPIPMPHPRPPHGTHAEERAGQPQLAPIARHVGSWYTPCAPPRRGPSRRGTHTPQLTWRRCGHAHILEPAKRPVRTLGMPPGWYFSTRSW